MFSNLMKITLILCALLSSAPLFAQNINPLDKKILNYMDIFKTKPAKTIAKDNPKKYEFGKKLFEDKLLSLSKDITCKSCHEPKLGTGDAIPFSIGVGGIGLGVDRVQNIAGITPRNAPHLFNKGSSKFRALFWDGRVSYDIYDEVYTTPDENLNGFNPKYDFIVKKIENVLAMQALFPMTSDVEMKGEQFSNYTNLQTWNEITKRIKADSKYKEYITSDFNIADIANALSYFQTIEFQVNDTPFDQYSIDNLNALSLKEKQGALVFFEKGRCARCHFGPILSNTSFQSISTPQIGPGMTIKNNDEGRYLVTNNPNDKYKFLTQPLKNVALTAPFYHAGSFNTLKEVINHYDNPAKSINNYDVAMPQKLFGNNYNEYIFVDKNHYNNFYRVDSLNRILKTPLRMSPTEKRNLECFITKSLTQKKIPQAC